MSVRTILKYLRKWAQRLPKAFQLGPHHGGLDGMLRAFDASYHKLVAYAEKIEAQQIQDLQGTLDEKVKEGFLNAQKRIMALREQLCQEHWACNFGEEPPVGACLRENCPTCGVLRKEKK